MLLKSIDQHNHRTARDPLKILKAAGVFASWNSALFICEQPLVAGHFNSMAGCTWQIVPHTN